MFSMMDEERFWAIIADSRARVGRGPEGDQFLDRQMEELGNLLSDLPPQEILAFQNRFAELSSRAHRWDLWGAAYWLHGGCSNDGFMDFRSTLISLGRERYELALRDPDSLADIDGQPDVPYLQTEGFGYVPHQVYVRATGSEFPEGTEFPSPLEEPAGEQWDFDDVDEMRRRFPKLVAKYPSGGG